MGEAKRRREAPYKPAAYRDLSTNQIAYGRPAGDPLKYFNEFMALGMANAGTETRPANVPCNGCSECCYYKSVEVKPHEETPEALAVLETEVADDGSLLLRKRPDGACTHLGPNGCTVYPHRPRVCRLYDCRVCSLFSIRDGFDNGHVSPVWVFQPQSRESRVFQAACNMTGFLHQVRAKQTGETASAMETVAHGMLHFSEFLDALDTLSRALPEMLTQMLGRDPRTVTPEETAAVFQQLLGQRLEPPSEP